MSEAQALGHAREALRQGNKAAARQILTPVLRLNPHSELGWLLMSVAADDPLKERDCLQRVLMINPGNEVAQRHLAGLDQEQPPLHQVVSPRPAQPPVPASSATCPYCGKLVQPSATFCGYCGRDLRATTVPAQASDVPLEQRVETLDRRIAQYVNKGFRLHSRSDTTAQLIKPKKFSFVLAALGLLLWGLGLILYLLYFWSQKDQVVFLQVDAQGRIHDSSLGSNAGARGSKIPIPDSNTGASGRRVPVVWILAAALLVLMSAGFCAQLSSPTGSSSPTVLPHTVKSLQDFEKSLFCRTYSCRLDDQWNLHKGGINNYYHIDAVPEVSVEIETIDGVPKNSGMVFYSRQRLSADDHHLIHLFLSSMYPGIEVDTTTSSFVAQNVETDVFQICEAESTPFGSVRIWAGKIGQQTVHIGPSCP